MLYRFLILLMSYFVLHGEVTAQMSAHRVIVERDQPMNYLLYRPEKTGEPLPLVVFLHGGGESGDNIELVKTHGPPKLIEAGKEFPFYLFAPQNPYKRGLWDDRMVNYMVDELIDSLNIDTKRIYLTGLSRGGNGIWRMAINNPGKYAAMISICAAAIPMFYLNRVANLPVWFFHGEQDTVIPVQQTITAYGKMKIVNEKTRITLYPDAGHDSWTKTFENPSIYDWLLSQHLDD